LTTLHTRHTPTCPASPPACPFQFPVPPHLQLPTAVAFSAACRRACWPSLPPPATTGHLPLSHAYASHSHAPHGSAPCLHHLPLPPHNQLRACLWRYLPAHTAHLPLPLPPRTPQNHTFPTLPAYRYTTTHTSATTTTYTHHTPTPRTHAPRTPAHTHAPPLHTLPTAPRHSSTLPHYRRYTPRDSCGLPADKRACAA